MAIRNPTSLVVDFNTDLKTEIAHNKFAVNRLITNTLNLPLGSYSVGSIDISNADSDVFLGHAGTGVILSDKPINITLGQSTPVITKLFAYDGVKMPITVSTTSLKPITVEYVIGDKVATVPDAPTITGVSVGDGSAIVTFDVPYYDGGSEITSYTVTAQPGNITATGTTSPISVDGLINGTAYTFTMVATNGTGDSLVSNMSAEVTPESPPIIVPAAPVITSVTVGPGVYEATITFDVPADNGSPILGYTITAQPGGSYTNGTESPMVFTELTPGETYTFTITATNANGIGVASAPSEAILIPIVVPDAPVITDAVINNTVATISFTTPNDNGSPITNYTVVYQPNGGVTYGQSSPIDVINLRGGTEYTFTVVAENSFGNSPQSQPSQPLMAVATVPGQVFLDNLIPGTDYVDVYFSIQDDGGTNITSYTITELTSNFTYTAYQSPYTVTGLTSGTQYLFGIHATNSVGDGPESTAMSVMTN